MKLLVMYPLVDFASPFNVAKQSLNVSAARALAYRISRKAAWSPDICRAWKLMHLDRPRRKSRLISIKLIATSVE